MSREVDWPRLRGRVRYASRGQVLELAVRLSHLVAGNIVEFGVAEGDSTRVIRGALSRLEHGQVGGARKEIFACDSFEGLPEKFENTEVGTFACDPPKIRGVEIVRGYFADSLTPDLAHRVGRVALASLDADLYSSTLTALRWLTPLLHTGSLLLFDEFLGEKESEKRALEAWLSESGVQVVRIALLARQPSGYGKESTDQRALFQVVGDAALRNRTVTISKPVRAIAVLGAAARRMIKMITHRMIRRSKA